MNLKNTKTFDHIIYTLTLNPTLDITIETNNIKKDDINLTDFKSVSAGGKGFNTSRALKCLGIETTAISFLGGFFKEDIERLLNNEQMDFYTIPLVDNTRANIKVIEKASSKLVEFNGKGPRIKQHEIDALFDYLDKISKVNSTYFVISGSLPQNTDLDIYGEIIKFLKKKEAYALLDTSGLPLYHGITHLPDIIKINRRELNEVCEKYFKMKPSDFIVKYISKGISMIMITDGPGKIMYYDRENTYEITPPDINGPFKTGAGDSVNAGLLYAIVNKFDIEKMLKFAAACGSANITNEIPGKIEQNLVIELFSKIEIKKRKQF